MCDPTILKTDANYNVINAFAWCIMAKAASQQLGRRFLLRCANEHNDFRIPELQSLATLFQINFNWIEKNDTKPYMLIDVSSEEEVKRIMSRTLLIRSAYELWARAASYQELHKQLKEIPQSFLKPYSHPDCSFSIQVETYCKTLTLEQKVAKIEELSYLSFEGPVNLRNPNVSLTLLEFYGVNPNNIPDEPYDVFFGRWICDGQRNKISKLTLKNRKFIGNTSMDAQLSLIMANQALVKKNSLVYDPFVGSGSLLVAAAYFGAHVWGVDIDYLMLHGKAKPTRFRQQRRDDDESIAANLRQYNLSSCYLDVIVGDSSRSLWRNGFTVDAIITDPPYGIREATERIGTTKTYQISEKHLESHIPSKVHYSTQDLYVDLLNFAAKYLKIGGRLVYWLPVYLDDYSEESIPQHPCLKLIGNSEQPLAKQASRRLVTMSKFKEVMDTEIFQANVSEKIARFSKQYFKAVVEKRSQRERRLQTEKQLNGSV